MGLLDTVLGALTGGQQGQNPMLNLIMGMLLNQKSGGLAGLLQQFQANGLGNVANSWVSTGQNMPVSADQLRNVFGTSQMQEMAAKVGLSPDAFSGQLAELLPRVVDRVTPNGAVPEQSSLEQGLSGLLQGFLNK